MELKSYLTPLLKWWWLVALSTVVAAASTAWFIRDLPPVYQARATLVIGNVLSNATGGDLGQAQQLASLYAAVAQQDTVREAARQALDLPSLPAYSVKLSGNGVFIEIAVTDTNPKLAQVAANELAHQLVLRSPSAQQTASPRMEFVNQQLDNLESSIKKTQVDMQAKQAELDNATSASQIASLQSDLKALQDKFATLQATYANLLATAPQSFSNIISIAEPAGLPLTPVGPNKPLLLLVAAAAGLVLSAGTAYLLEFLDDTLKTSEEITQIFQSPLIGFVPVLEKKWAQSLYVVDQPQASGAEAFRSLRTNLEFAGVDQPLKSILVTSTGAEEGKSTIAVNLALTLAQSGKQVVLVDCDLRCPNVRNFFPIQSPLGLSDVLRGQVGLSDVVYKSATGGLSVLPAGTPPPNPAEMLGSKKMEHVLASLQATYEVIVVDSPPFLISDSWILSAKVDGVTLVVLPGRTSKHAARATLDQIRRGHARLVGVILNRVQPRGGSYYYRSYLQSARKTSPTGLRGWLARAAAWGRPTSPVSPSQPQPQVAVRNGSGIAADPAEAAAPTASSSLSKSMKR